MNSLTGCGYHVIILKKQDQIGQKRLQTIYELSVSQQLKLKAEFLKIEE